MGTAILIAAAACACAVVASWLMWWSTRRSAAWAMVAGSLGALLALASAVLIAWFLTEAVGGD